MTITTIETNKLKRMNALIMRLRDENIQLKKRLARYEVVMVDREEPEPAQDDDVPWLIQDL